MMPRRIFNQVLLIKALLLVSFVVFVPWVAQEFPRPFSHQPVVVAVVDTGADINHSSLKGSVWTNPGESGFDDKGRARDSNGVDDDGNGYIDDIYGWNFATDESDVSDPNGHGTHVAGIIAQLAKRARALSGEDYVVRVMNLKVYDPKADPQTASRAMSRAISYATKMGAQVINISGGGSNPDIEEERAVLEALDKDVLVVAASGNKSESEISKPFFPAGYRLPNVVSVAAINRGGKVLATSNFLSSLVDVVAPGHNIVSALPGNQYGALTGSSQATAFVSGVAAISFHLYSNLNVDERRRLVAMQIQRATLERWNHLLAMVLPPDSSANPVPGRVAQESVGVSKDVRPVSLHQ